MVSRASLMVKDSDVRRPMENEPPSQSTFNKARLRMTESLLIPCAPNTTPASLDTTPAEGQFFVRM